MPDSIGEIIFCVVAFVFWLALVYWEAKERHFESRWRHVGLFIFLIIFLFALTWFFDRWSEQRWKNQKFERIMGQK